MPRETPEDFDLSDQTLPAVLLTRPHRQADRFAAALRGRFGDVSVVVSPVIDIRRIGDLPEIGPDAAGIVLTSTSALDVLGAKELGRLAGVRCWCVGARTAQVAQRMGLVPVVIAADGAELAARLRADPPAGVLVHPCGRHVAVPLASLVADAGVRVIPAVVYDQVALPLSAPARALLTGAVPVLVPLFSPRSARLLGMALHDPLPSAPLLVAAISPATAATWRETAPRDVTCHIAVSDRPDGGALLDLMIGLRDFFPPWLEGREGAG